MPSLLGGLRLSLLAPSLTEVSFAGRGFPVRPSAVTEQLEAIPSAVVCGFEWAIAGAGIDELHNRLHLMDPEQRGFGYEGAAMACTVLDSFGGDRTRRLLSGPGAGHLLLGYIGVGFALARLPRPVWRRALPDLTGARYHPSMSWLAVDGYGFDLAYFDTERWVNQQQVPRSWPWQGCPQYFPRAVDQGIGRALWFIHGADVAGVRAAVGRFADSRQADLWSGVGLAATFALGAGPEQLAELAENAGQNRPDLALGSVFAVKGRSDAGHLPDGTEAAATALTGRPLGQLLDLVDRTEPNSTLAPASTAEPPYELWRRRIRHELAAPAAERRPTLTS